MTDQNRIKSFFLDSAQTPKDLKSQFTHFDLLMLKEYGELILDETKESFETKQYINIGLVEEQARFNIESVQHNLEMVTIAIVENEKHDALSYFDMNDEKVWFYIGKN